MAFTTYPLNDIDYQAEDAELFHVTRTSGVYASGHFPISVTGTDNNVVIGKGIGWIKNTEFSGKVFASKEETTLNVGVPDASLPRIDAVVVRFDANQNETYLTTKQGSVGSTPNPPEVERGEYIYELHLYHIRRKPGATAITPGDVTDLRMDANYCGLMADSVTQVDMAAINAQIREFISDWEGQIANVTNGKLVESADYPGCFYRLYGGLKEWLNPPMVVGEEYRTTDRMDGKTVYVKLLKANSQAGRAALPDAEKVVSLSAVAISSSSSANLAFQIPAFDIPSDSKRLHRMQIYYDDGTIHFESVISKGMYDLYITAKYTKSGETEYTNVYQENDILFVDTSGNYSSSGDNVNVQMYADVSSEDSGYVRSLTINGNRYNLAVNQTGSGSPGNAHEGALGQLYMDIDTGTMYKCTAISGGVYTWDKLENGTGGGTTVSMVSKDYGYDMNLVQEGAIESYPLSLLPEVTAENNGSFLRVVDGKWAVASIANAEGASF